jgi:hypothetical protein
LALRRFVGFALDEDTPGHSKMSRTRRLTDPDARAAVSAWVLEVLARGRLIVGKRAVIAKTTLVTKATMRSMVRRHRHQSMRFSDRFGQGVRHRDADTRRTGAVGPQAQEAHVGPGLEEPCRQ